MATGEHGGRRAALWVGAAAVLTAAAALVVGGGVWHFLQGGRDASRWPAFVALGMALIICVAPPLWASVKWRRARKRTGLAYGALRWSVGFVAWCVVCVVVAVVAGDSLRGTLFRHPRGMVAGLCGGESGKAAKKRFTKRPTKQTPAAPPPLTKDAMPSRGDWTTAFGGKGSESVTDLLALPDGYIVSGRYRDGFEIASATVGGTPYACRGASGRNPGPSIFVARLDRGGGVVWVKTYDHAYGGHVALDPDGDVWLATSFTDHSLAFGDRRVGGARHLAVVKLDTDGTERWRSAGKRSAQVMPTTIAATSDGAFIGGSFGPGTVQLAGIQLQAPPGRMGAFIARLDKRGDFVWARQLGALGVSVHQIAPHRDGIAVGASFDSGTVDWGGAPVANFTLARDLLIATYGAAGEPGWATRIGGPQAEEFGALVVKNDGAIAVAGRLERGPLVVGTSEFSDEEPADPFFVVELDDTGAVRWVALSGKRGGVPRAIGANTQGDVVVTGFTYAKPLVFGEFVLGASRGRDAFIARLGSGGQDAWVERLAVGHVTPFAATLRGDTATIAGQYADTLTIDGTSHAHRGRGDVWVTERQLPKARKRLVPSQKLPATIPVSLWSTKEPRPRNPSHSPGVEPYISQVFTWLGLGLPPVILDTLRRVDFRGSAGRTATQMRAIGIAAVIQHVVAPALRHHGEGAMARALLDAKADPAKLQKLLEQKRKGAKLATQNVYLNLRKAAEADVAARPRRGFDSADSQHATWIAGAAIYASYLLPAGERAAPLHAFVLAMKDAPAR